MKHVVFLVGSYYPNYSAVGNCAEKIITLLKDDFKVSIVAAKNDTELNCFEEFDGCDIYRIESKYQKKLNILNFEMKYNQTFFTKFKLYATRAFNLLKFIFQKESINPDLVNSYLSALKCLNKKNKIDIVIPVCLPVESILASLVFKKLNSKVVVIPYIFDHFSRSSSLHRFNLNKKLKLNHHLDIEKFIVNHSDAVFAMHPLSKHYGSFIDPKHREKIIFVEHPLLLKANKISKHNMLSGFGGINVTYTGSFIKKYVEPNYLLELFAFVDNSLNIKLNLYTVGNCNDLTNSYAKKFPLKIFNHGSVSKHVANLAVVGADVLVNVGEVSGKQISSKIFEYMSVGKPIVHLSFVSDDVVSDILSKYPETLILAVNENNFLDDVNKLDNFMKTAKNKTVSFQVLSNIYPEALPETTANLFKKQINESCEKAALR
jgi:hypothetical protein